MYTLYYVRTEDLMELIHFHLPQTDREWIIVRFDDSNVGEIGYYDFRKWHRIKDFPYKKQFLHDYLMARRKNFSVEDCYRLTHYYDCGCIEEVRWGHFEHNYPQCNGCITCGNAYRSNPYPPDPIVICDEHINSPME